MFDRYGKQTPAKPASGSETSKPAGSAPTSTFLSRLAGQVGSSGGGAGGSSGGSGGAGMSGSSQLWKGSSSNQGTRASIEKRLHWVETAFKKTGESGLSQQSGMGGDPRQALSSVRNRINALLTYDLSPKVRGELELIDRELAKLL